MSILNFLSESMYKEESEDDIDLGAPEGDTRDDTQDDTGDQAEDDVPAEDTSLEDQSGGEGNPKALVNELIKNAPNKMKEIKNMLKYAANSSETYDVFDAALDYFESIEKNVNSADEQNAENQKDTEETDVPTDDENLDDF